MSVGAALVYRGHGLPQSPVGRRFRCHWADQGPVPTPGVSSWAHGCSK